MVYHVSKHNKAIFSWMDDSSGFASIMLPVVHLDSGPILDNRLNKNYKTNIEIYNKYYCKSYDEDRSFFGFKFILFGRNPYYRVLSYYIDKYVLFSEQHNNNNNNTSAQNITFYEFISKQESDCAQITDEEIKIYEERLTNSKKTEETLIMIPDGCDSEQSIFHKACDIEHLYTLFRRRNMFARIAHILCDQTATTELRKTDTDDMCHMSPAEIRFRITNNQLCFNTIWNFSKELKSKFKQKFESEINFYSKRGLEF